MICTNEVKAIFLQKKTITAGLLQDPLDYHCKLSTRYVLNYNINSTPTGYLTEFLQEFYSLTHPTCKNVVSNSI